MKPSGRCESDVQEFSRRLTRSTGSCKDRDTAMIYEFDDMELLYEVG